MHKSLSLLLLLVGVTFARHINDEGLALIKHYEGFFPNFYKDLVGIRTIGYGHVCHSGNCRHIHPPLSKHHATELLKTDLHQFEHCVDSFVKGLNENQFSALVSFTYNLGCGSLKRSSLGKNLKKHNYKAVAGQFGLWVHADNQVLQGLVKRRHAERALFCKSGGC